MQWQNNGVKLNKWHWWIREYCGISGCKNRAGDTVINFTFTDKEEFTIRICNYHAKLVSTE